MRSSGDCVSKGMPLSFIVAMRQPSLSITTWSVTNEENGMYDSNSRSFSKIFNLSKITCDP